MNQINREITEDSLRYFYKKNWRQGLLTHILIGIGGIIREISEPESPEAKLALFEDFDEKEIERLKPIKELEERPLEYVRAIDEQIAYEVSSQPSLILRIASLSSAGIVNRSCSRWRKMRLKTPTRN